MFYFRVHPYLERPFLGKEPFLPHCSDISVRGSRADTKNLTKYFLEDLVFGQSLSDLELNEDNMEEIIARCRQLQVETIRFTRWRQMDMLEDFIKSQNGSFETK